MPALAQQEDGLLESIAEFCRISGMAESTFGRHAVNDGERRYLEATREVLQAHGGLWFFDESYVVSRKRG